MRTLLGLLTIATLLCWTGHAQTNNATSVEPTSSNVNSTQSLPANRTETNRTAPSPTLLLEVILDEAAKSNQTTNQSTTTVKTVQGPGPTNLPDVTATSQDIILLTNSTSDRPITVSTTTLDTNTSSPVWDNQTTTSPGTTELQTESSTHSSTDEGVTEHYIPVFPNSTQENDTANNVTQPTTIFVLKFGSSCSGDADALSITNLLTSLTNLDMLQVANPRCERVLTFDMRVQNVTEPKSLEGMLRNVSLTLKEGNFSLLSVQEVDSDTGYVPKMAGGLPFTSREVLVYAIVGAIFGVAILLVLILLCCKCCCPKGRKGQNDVPHLTMRLEDYSLTRIPRPNTIYSDARASGHGNGVDRPSQPFDTSVVPMEESDSYGRRELQSFNSRRYRHRSPEIEDDLYSRSSSARAGSTERLARDFQHQRGRRGVENQNFRY